MTTLPANVSLRPCTRADFQAVVDLFLVCDIADSGQEDTNPEDVLTEWREEGFELERDASVLVTSTGEIVGYTDVHRSRLGMVISPFTLVHPDYRRQGLERYLLHLSEARALQYLNSAGGQDIKRTLKAYGLTDFLNQMLEEEGYQIAKIDWRMESEFTEPPPAPVWPEGISVRTYRPGEEEPIIHRIIQEAFSQLRGRTYQPFEAWKAWALERDDFDPTLLFVVLAGEEPIGSVMCFGDQSWLWVRQLGILKPWQRKGIGTQLLRHVFGEGYRRGLRRAGLIVDSENPSGATYVYQNAGMHVASQLRWYQKEV